MSRVLLTLLRRVKPLKLQSIRFSSKVAKGIDGVNVKQRDTITHKAGESDPIDLSRTFDALDSSSMKTMEKILDILHDAEEQSDSKKTNNLVHSIETLEDTKYLNEFTTRFGEEIFEYKVIRYLNDSEIIGNDPTIWGTVPDAYNDYIKEFTNEYLQMNNSFFKNNEITFNGNLNHFQSIAKYFMENDSRCLQRISREIEILAKYQRTQTFTKKKYNFPKLSLPPPYPYDSENPLVIMKALSTKKELNLLPFIVNDRDVIEKLIIKNQVRNKNEVTPVEMILSLMEAQELEGSKLFTIMVKKCLYSTNQLNNQKLIDTLLNNESIKSIIASESKIPSRLFSYNNYKLALSGSSVVNIDDDLKILELLKSQFNRFFGLFYRISAFEAEKWMSKLVEFYLQGSSIDTTKLSNESIEYFKQFMSSVEMDTSKSKWTKKWQIKQ